jgi:DNA polymerase-1
MVADDQLNIYQTLFQPGMVDIIQMQLTGLPINMATVKKVKAEMQADFDRALHTISNSKIAKDYEYRRAAKWVVKRNKELKKKRVSLIDCPQDEKEFNPRSAPQLQDLLFEVLQLPVIDLTDSKLPSTDADTFKALLNHTGDPYVTEFLQAMLDFKLVEKILGTFIPAMENAQLGPDGWYYMFGNFNLGGTVSGRLSSNDPNLTNLPAGGHKGRKGEYGKMIKSCVEAPPGWIYAGLDFASLEDRISALTTKDPNKLKVYTDGYDGHCLRAHAYFGDQMPDIDPGSVESINSIEKKYKIFRQDSKAPTFALTYQGTYSTLMKNCGFTMTLALSIEAAYRSLYKVSIDWVQAKLDQASRDGYVTAAFGLRVRTPRLAQVIRGTSKTPREADAEGRTAGNALGQSWCLLNTRAGVEFNAKVRQSEHRLDIRPCAQIHDAQYFIVREDLKALAFMNEHLVKAVQWQDHPDIWHDEVKLGGEVSVFFPDWSSEIGIPNGADEAGILDALNDGMEKLAA